MKANEGPPDVDSDLKNIAFGWQNSNHLSPQLTAKE